MRVKSEVDKPLSKGTLIGKPTFFSFSSSLCAKKKPEKLSRLFHTLQLGWGRGKKSRRGLGEGFFFVTVKKLKEEQKSPSPFLSTPDFFSRFHPLPANKSVDFGSREPNILELSIRIGQEKIQVWFLMRKSESGNDQARFSFGSLSVHRD